MATVQKSSLTVVGGSGLAVGSVGVTVLFTLASSQYAIVTVNSDTTGNFIRIQGAGDLPLPANNIQTVYAYPGSQIAVNVTAGLVKAAWTIFQNS